MANRNVHPSHAAGIISALSRPAPPHSLFTRVLTLRLVVFSLTEYYWTSCTRTLKTLRSASTFINMSILLVSNLLYHGAIDLHPNQQTKLQGRQKLRVAFDQIENCHVMISDNLRLAIATVRSIGLLNDRKQKADLQRRNPEFEAPTIYDLHHVTKANFFSPSLHDIMQCCEDQKCESGLTVHLELRATALNENACGDFKSRMLGNSGRGLWRSYMLLPTGFIIPHRCISCMLEREREIERERDRERERARARARGRGRGREGGPVHLNTQVS